MKPQDKSNKQTGATIQPGSQVARYSPGQEKIGPSTDETIDVFSAPTHTSETVLKEKRSHAYIVWVLVGLIVLVIGAGVVVFLVK